MVVEVVPVTVWLDTVDGLIDADPPEWTIELCVVLEHPLFLTHAHIVPGEGTVGWYGRCPCGADVGYSLVGGKVRRFRL
jgi:hypothetical protein